VAKGLRIALRLPKKILLKNFRLRYGLAPVL
jgi:hypothetical protein